MFFRFNFLKAATQSLYSDIGPSALGQALGPGACWTNTSNFIQNNDGF